MPKIKLLPDILANKIAAGEVVERPASVLKELLENAVDAGADRIFAAVEGGGRKNITLVDNGCGMEPDDMLLAIERHATSKLIREEDLFAVRSLGFRGEALPSIASVSRLTLESRVADRETGQRILVEGGTVRNVEEIAMPVGTRISASRLFYNTPVRLKFLKSVSTEMQHVADGFIRTALACPDIRFELRVDGKKAMEFPKGTTLRDRLVFLWGRAIAGRTLDFSSGAGLPRVSGLLAPPEISRTAPRHLYVYVNGRPVKDRLIHKAVLDAYRPFLSKGAYPLAVLLLETDPAEVDVNVHPAKAEVRFRSPSKLYDLVVRAVEGGLASETPDGIAATRSRSSTGRAPDWGRRPGDGMPRFAAVPARPIEGRRHEVREPAASPVPAQPEESVEQLRLPSMEPAPLLKVIGQLGKSYILLETDEGLLIVDQHAAHERIVYHRLKNSLAQGPVPRQALVSPAILDLTPRESLVLKDLREELGAAGIELEPFGETTYLVRTIPAVCAGLEATVVVRDVLARIEGPSQRREGGSAMEHVLASMACHGSVRSGRALNQLEMEALVEDLMALKGPHHCPHGRPVWKRVDYPEILRDLKRT